MENYKITKEQVLKLANKAEQGCTSVIESDLKNWFPEVFKTELEVGKWYVYGRSLLNYQGLNNKDLIQAYGFLEDKSWMETSNCGNDFKEWKESTPEEVSAALINEAKKRGFKLGVKVVGLYNDGSPHQITDFIINKDDFTYKTLDNALVCNKLGFRIFAKGKWAEILPQEKTVVPIAKALKIIAKKMKVSPENIEIQY